MFYSGYDSFVKRWIPESWVSILKFSDFGCFGTPILGNVHIFYISSQMRLFIATGVSLGDSGGTTASSSLGVLTVQPVCSIMAQIALVVVNRYYAKPRETHVDKIINVFICGLNVLLDPFGMITYKTCVCSIKPCLNAHSTSFNPKPRICF